MIFASIPGTLGRDSELKDTRSGPVLSFSVATEDRVGREKTTTWVRCSLFGKRGTQLAQYLVKGSRVVVFGQVKLHEYNGKTSLECAVSDITLMGGRSGNATSPAAEPAPTGGGGFSDEEYGEKGEGDNDWPF